LGATTHNKTLTKDTGNKTWYARAESDQGGQGQEQALDRQEVQELFPHCCLFVFLSFPYLTFPFDRLLDKSSWTSEEVLDSPSTQQHIFFCLYVYVMVFPSFLFTRFNLLFGVAILIATLDCLLSGNIQTSFLCSAS
jgi:hypothetical protein